MFDEDFTKVETNLKLLMAVYPSNMAPIGVKVWDHTFRTIPNISFLDAGKNDKQFGSEIMFSATLVRFLRNYTKTDFKIRFGMKFKMLL